MGRLAPPVPRRVWVVLAVLVCLGLAILMLFWRGMVRRQVFNQRVLLLRVAATMAAPSISRDAGETGLENRFVWALGVRANELHITPERLEERFLNFGDRIWGDVGDSALDAALKALAHRRLQTALERALTAAHDFKAPPRERRVAQMLAGHLLASTVLWAQAGETPEKLYRAALASCDRASEPLAWADAQGYLAEALRGPENFEESRHHADEAIAIRTKILGARDPSLVRWILCRGRAAANSQEGVEYLKQALLLQSGGGDLTPREIQHIRQLAGRILFEARRLAEAEPYLRQAAAEGETTGPTGVLDLAKALSDLGALHAKLHRPAEAEPLLLRALALTEKTAGPRDDEVLHPLLGLGDTKLEQQDWPAAEQYARRVLEGAQRSHAPERGYFITRAYDVLATVMQLSGQLPEAEASYRLELAATEAFFGAENLNTATVLSKLAVNLREQKRLTEAERLLRRALTIEDKLLPADDPERGAGLGNLGLLVAQAGRPQDGEVLLLRALSLFSKQPEPVFSLHAIHLNNLAEVYFMEGRKEEGVAQYRKALAMIAQVQVQFRYTPPAVKTLVKNYAGALVATGMERSAATQQAEAALQESLAAAQSAQK